MVNLHITFELKYKIFKIPEEAATALFLSYSHKQSNCIPPIEENIEYIYSSFDSSSLK